MMPDYNTIQSDVRVCEAISLLHNNPARFFLVMDGATPIGLLHRFEIIEAVAERKYEKTVDRLLLRKVICYESKTQLEEIVEELSGNDEMIHPVVRNGKMIGAINLEHLIEHLLIYKADTHEYDAVKMVAAMM